MPTDYPPLPQPLVQNWPSGKWSYTANQMHAYLATERKRIEREVSALTPKYSGWELHNAILRAIRGEKS